MHRGLSFIAGPVLTEGIAGPTGVVPHNGCRRTRRESGGRRGGVLAMCALCDDYLAETKPFLFGIRTCARVDRFNRAFFATIPSTESRYPSTA